MAKRRASLGKNSQKKLKKLEFNNENKEKVNHDLAKVLEELADFEKNVNGQIYKHNALHKAAYNILHYTKKIESGEQAKAIDGVGKKIAAKIDEFIETGKIQELEDMKSSNLFKIISDLNRVMGIGPSHARKLYSKGIKSIEDLRKRTDELTNEQQIGLKYLDDFEKKVSREEMEKIEKLIIDEVKMIDEKFQIHMCGSYRRGALFSNDIDILVTHPKYISRSFAKTNNISPDDENYIIHYKQSPRKLLDKIIDKLTDIDFLNKDVIAYGDTKFMGICQLTNDSPFRRIDIRIFPYDEFFTALLYYTGSQTFNHEMRKNALKKGYTLNEYSLRKVSSNGNAGKPLPINSEKDIFDYLEMDYKEPAERSMD